MFRPFVSRSLGITLIIFVAAFQGCTFFAGKPPLPRNASLEDGVAPGAEVDFAALVAAADIIYFPVDHASSGARSEPAALLLDALLQSGTSFAIAWDSMEASQQPLLDELPGNAGRAKEAIIDRLEVAGTGRAREHCRAVLRDGRLASIHHLALRCPEVMIAKIDAREKFTAEEQKELPAGYAPPPGGFEAYTERLASSSSPGDGALARSYKAHVAIQQFAAERIVRHVRGSGQAGKLFVFLRGSDMEAGLGVPRYVRQKLSVRQLVFEASGSAPIRGKLLTRWDGIGGAL